VTGVVDRWGHVLLACAVGVPVLVVLIAVRARWVGWRLAAAELGSVAGTLPWLWMILTPLPQPGAVHPVPFQEVPDYLHMPWGEFVVQVGGNLAVFAAFGALTPVRWRMRLATVAVAAAAGSITVETLQWALDLGRVMSADDVMLNTTGALLAALATRPWHRPR
jgi:glycopeptide antibiotics resistance protein